MHVDRSVEFFGDHADFFQVFVAHGVGGMGAEGDFDAVMVLEVAEQLDALTNGFVRRAGAGNGEIENRDRDLCANAALMHALGGNLREEIHVREAGDATFDLLGDGQIRAVADKILVDPFGFGGPDVVFQPGHERQVIGQAAEQGHRRMSVSIDQAGAEQDVR